MSAMDVDVPYTPAVYNPDDLPELLNIYYKRLFPYGLFYRWLNYGSRDRTFFSKREFSFTLKDDIYVRYQSFENQKDFEKSIQDRRPYKIDIGAVFSERVQNAISAPNVKPVQRELVFDIDMNDYDDVRFCCTETNICWKCWPLMTTAIKILNKILTDDFGFEDIMFVFSGRRGVHCWVSDEKARLLRPDARNAIIDYINLTIKGGTGTVGSAKKMRLSSYTLNYAAVSRSLSIVQDHFWKHLVRDQQLLANQKAEAKILSMIEDPAVVERYKSTVDCVYGSDSRWKKLCDIVEAKVKEDKDSKKRNWSIVHVLDEIQFEFCYPRLDVNVSNSLNHLLKSPFSVHPKTGRVCVPIDPNNVDSFDPFKVPTVAELQSQINDFDAMHPEDATSENPTPEWKKTGLQEGIVLFEKYVRKMEASRRKLRDEQMDSTYDF